MASPKALNRYTRILAKIFADRFHPGDTHVDFPRAAMETVAAELNIVLPKNLGDVLYSFRYRVALPKEISATAPAGRMWIIRSVGRSLYRFALVREWTPEANPNMDPIKVPDATPGVIAKYRLSDEQALLARVRYNRLIDIFSGIVCYSLQNHLRTSVEGLGPIETDEVYVGVDRRGSHYVLPVQAKGGNDRLSVVQIEQDIALARERFPDLICRPIGAQFMADGAIALIEFTEGDDGLAIRNEAHYRLVPPEELTPEDLARYRLGER